MSQVIPFGEARIIEIGGSWVMLDSDLAALYGVETRALLQQVRRNKERFPKDFMFQLSEGEWQRLRSQSVISKSPGRGGRRSRPHVFTEHGVAMLSSVLRSERAVAVNIEIVRAFVALRRKGRELEAIGRRLDELEGLTVSTLKAHDRQLAEIFTVLRRLTGPPTKSRHPVGFRIRQDGDDAEV